MTNTHQFQVGDRVQLTKDALRAFPKYRADHYGVIVDLYGFTAHIETVFGEETWTLAWWEPAPAEPWSPAWLHARAMDAAFARE